MEKQIIVSIGREHGSEGHKIAELLAQKLDFPLYDKNIFEEIGRTKGIDTNDISKYDESELVKLAESYAKRRGYDVSEEVRQVVLKDVFEKRMENGKDVNYEDVMAVIDEAVVKLEKRNMKNLFMTVLDNAYTQASMCTLIPEDFN